MIEQLVAEGGIACTSGERDHSGRLISLWEIPEREPLYTEEARCLALTAYQEGSWQESSSYPSQEIYVSAWLWQPFS
jgi:hypothetical protein